MSFVFWFFFFKRKTAYEMRISDWSSDVCSSDLRAAQAPPDAPLQDPGRHQAPSGHAGPGRQGRARRQGRGPDHLAVAGRPLLRADAQHRQGRRHLDRKSVVEGKSVSVRVDLGGRRIIKTNTQLLTITKVN